MGKVKVAVTGGLSSGKSTLCRLFKEEGAVVVDSDEIVHQLLSSHPDTVRRVAELLGAPVLIDGKIDRKRVAEEVFADRKKLTALEAILHPAVEQEIERQYASMAAGVFVAEIPLLFEGGIQDRFDYTLAVYVDDAVAMARYGDPADYARRMARQLSPKQKAEKAHIVIQNDGNLKSLKRTVKELMNQWKKKLQ